MTEWVSEGVGPGLGRYLEVTWRRKWIVVAVVVAAIAAAAAASFAVEPVYRAEMTMVVGQGKSLFPVNQANAFQPFTATMGDLVETRIVAERVIQRLGIQESPKSLLGEISVSTNPDTAVLKVSVDDGDPERARQIAEAIGTVFPGLVRERFGSASVGTGVDQTPPLTVSVFDPAQASATPVSPRPVRNVALAGVLGLVLGVLAAFLADYFDRSLRTRESVERSFGVPVIGQVPFQRKASRPVDWTRSPEGAEAFRTLRANLQYLSVKRPIQTILVTSASAGQGKTTVSANLAIAIARSGATAVIVEGDLRRPMLPTALGVDGGGPGLTGVLIGTSDLSSALVDVPLPVGASGPAGRSDGRVRILPSGPLPPNPPELLSSERMTALLTELKGSYDYVLIDSPPLLPVADGLELARGVDGVILVVRRNRATSDEAHDVRNLVDRLGISLLGAVFTDSTPPASYYYGAAKQPQLVTPDRRAVRESAARVAPRKS